MRFRSHVFWAKKYNLCLSENKTFLLKKVMHIVVSKILRVKLKVDHNCLILI